MAHDPPASIERGSAYLRPWPLLLAGMGLAVLGLVLSGQGAPAVQALSLCAGLLVAAIAVGRHLRAAGWEFPDRLESAGLAGLLGVTAAVAYFGMARDWSSGRLFCAALVLVSMVGSGILLLPTLLRRIALSLIVLFHFTGIVATVTSVQPGPWLSGQLYLRIYRPYLTFIYMTNAYHFYSPDPGPAPLLWFAVHYDDGTYKWLKLPDRDSSPVGMHYQRMLTLPQHTFVANQRMPFMSYELDGARATRAQWEKEHADEKRFKPYLESWETIYRRRQLGSEINFKPYRIPVVNGLVEAQQYSEPQDDYKPLISSLGKYVFRNPPPPDSPGAKVISVKVYRVIHNVVTPAELASGVSPLEPNKYLPFFLGEFDGEGTMLDPIDPFLYWYLPIVKVPKNYSQPVAGPVGINVTTTAPANGIWLDCVEIHAARPYKAEQKR